MGTRSQIMNIAAEIAAAAENRAAALKNELAEIKEREAEVEAKLKTAHHAHKLLANFQVQIGRDYQCPRCWIENETRSALHAVGGGTNTRDFFSCGTCGPDVEISI